MLYVQKKTVMPAKDLIYNANAIKFFSNYYSKNKEQINKKMKQTYADNPENKKTKMKQTYAEKMKRRLLFHKQRRNKRKNETDIC
jgi:hypothetical protein